MITAYVCLTLLLTGAYVLLIIYILNNWLSIEPLDSTGHNQTGGVSYSFVIPARNEEHTIKACIESILENNFVQKRYEILVVDDHSEDNTLAVLKSITNPALQVLQLKDHLGESGTNNYKKEVINYALQKSKGDYIIQIDADTTVAENYLQTIDHFIKTNSTAFLAGPVLFKDCNSIIEHFQQLDYAGMMIVTAAGIQSKKWHLANGANMIYQKSGMKKHDSDFASGDDVFTIQHFFDSQKTVSFLKSKSAVVKTLPLKKLTALFSQRLRWATKNKHMKSFSMQVMMGIPFLNACWFIMHLLMLFVNWKIGLTFLLMHLIIKMGIDYVLVHEGTSFFGCKESMRYFIPTNLLHIPYLIVVGISSLFVRKYTWKGRKVS